MAAWGTFTLLHRVLVTEYHKLAPTQVKDLVLLVVVGTRKSNIMLHLVRAFYLCCLGQVAGRTDFMRKQVSKKEAGNWDFIINPLP